MKDAVIGYTSSSTAMLDLDNVTLKRAEQVAAEMMKRWKLWGYAIVKTSHRHYHVVFDRRLSWKNVLRVIFAVPECRKRYHNHFSWAEMQAIKGSATLRISNKGKKLQPKVMALQGLCLYQLKNYLSCKRLFGRM